jgi:hypothetical protein
MNLLKYLTYHQTAALLRLDPCLAPLRFAPQNLPCDSANLCASGAKLFKTKHGWRVKYGLYGYKQDGSDLRSTLNLIGLV